MTKRIKRFFKEFQRMWLLYRLAEAYAPCFRRGELDYQVIMLLVCVESAWALSRSIEMQSMGDNPFDAPIFDELTDRMVGT